MNRSDPSNRSGRRGDRRPTIAVDLRALARPHPTGIGVYTSALLEQLARRGAARYLGLSHLPPQGAEQLLANGVELERLPAPGGTACQHLRIPLRLRRGDVDLLWSPVNTLPWVCPVPAVVSVMDLTPILFPETHTWKTRLTYRVFLPRSLRRARRVVAISQATGADLRARFPDCAGKLRVAPCGVGREFVPAVPARVAELRAELGCPQGYLLYAGTLEPRKNVGELLDAWELLRRELPDAPPLLMAGAPGWRNDALQRRIESLGPAGVRHLGFVSRERLVSLFQGARAFAYPSLYEGFGLPPLEAMACGVPVVASDSSSLPEVVGDAGLLVELHDVPALAASLKSVFEDPTLAERLSRAGIQRAASFTWERAAADLEAVLLEAVSSSDG